MNPNDNRTSIMLREQIVSAIAAGWIHYNLSSGLMKRMDDPDEIIAALFENQEIITIAPADQRSLPIVEKIDPFDALAALETSSIVNNKLFVRRIIYA